MQIKFNLSSVFSPSSSTLENAEVLRALLDCLVSADLSYLRHHKAPRLYESKVIYGRTQEWERIPDVLARGYADCKSLSAWRIAELIHNRVYGDWVPTPTFRWKPRPSSGIKDFHILILLPNGQWECPSAVLGMGKEEAHFATARSWFR